MEGLVEFFFFFFSVTGHMDMNRNQLWVSRIRSITTQKTAVKRIYALGEFRYNNQSFKLAFVPFYWFVICFWYSVMI